MALQKILKKIELGEIIEWRERLWRVIGVDTHSQSINPNHPKWDYLFKNQTDGTQMKVVAIKDEKDGIIDFERVSLSG